MAAEEAAWNTASRLNTVAVYDVYLGSYPAGRFLGRPATASIYGHAGACSHTPGRPFDTAFRSHPNRFKSNALRP